MNLLPIKVLNLDRIKTNYFLLVVFVCDKCNYNCKCCYNEKPRTCQELDLNVLFDYIKFLQKNILKPIELNFLGGEPTLHSQLINFCIRLSKLKNVEVIIYSNSSLSIVYYDYLLRLNNIRFDLSYHTINGSRNKDCISKILALANKNFKHSKLNITLMLENKSAFDDIKKINLIFIRMKINKKHNIDYRLIRDFDNIDDMTYYSKDELDFFKENYINYNKVKTFEVTFNDESTKQFSIEEFDLNTFCKFNSWNCNAEKETLYCHCDGNIYGCQSRFIELKNPIFNLYDKFLLPSEKSVICDCKNCRIDCEVTKWK